MHFYLCTNCGMEFPLPDELGGQRTECPHCEGSIVEDSEAHTETYSLSPQTTRVPIQQFCKGKHATAGRYRLAEEIGRGGMGTVVRAFDSNLGRDVAVKFMLDPDTDDTRRFVQEAQVTGRLEHPNVVPVHELGVDPEGRPFLAMKLVRGRSLHAILRRLRDEPEARREWPLGRLLAVLVGVCHALEYAHSRAVLHRDLKPSNVMVGDFGEVYVMDWGLAKVGIENGSNATPPTVETNREDATDATQNGTVVGTPAYMSPEQAAGRVGEIDARSDVYALGAILYSVLTYVPPVETSGDRFAVLQRAEEGEILPPMRRVHHPVSPELSAVAMKALAKSPQNRYQTVAGFRSDVELFLEGRAVSARDDSPWEVLARFVKRNKSFSVVTLVSLAVLATVIGVAFWVTDAARREAEWRKREAEQSYRALRQEQIDKRERLKASAPAFVRAARLMANDRQFSQALVQARVAREYDPERAEAHLQEGTILIALERYDEAFGPLREYSRLAPNDPQASKLAALVAAPEPGTAAYFQRLGAIFEAQRDFVMVQEMAHRSERFLGLIRERLPAYQKRVEAAWVGCGSLLHIDKNGDLTLEFTSGVRSGSFVTDLTPLRGIPLARLEIQGGAIESLVPLQGMPLVRLDLKGCKSIKDLSPLHGMRLKELSLCDATGVSDLEPLRGMPLRKLDARNCRQVTNLAPLRGLPLVELNLMDCTGVRDLSPLAGMKLAHLSLMNCCEIKDLSPLRGMPIQTLDLHGLPLSRSSELEPLAGMPLKKLNLTECPVTSLETFAGMPLGDLTMDRTKVEDLSPLRGMKLTCLSLHKTPVRDFTPLRGMPLRSLHLGDCPHLKDLEFVRGMKLEILYACTERPLDLSPLEGMDLKFLSFNPWTAKEIAVLRRMPTLHTVDVGRGVIPVEKFWQRYDTGEFAK